MILPNDTDQMEDLGKWVKPVNYFASGGEFLARGALQLSELRLCPPILSFISGSVCNAIDDDDDEDDEAARRDETASFQLLREGVIRRFRIKLLPRHKFNESRREAARHDVVNEPIQGGALI